MDTWSWFKFYSVFILCSIPSGVAMFHFIQITLPAHKLDMEQGDVMVTEYE